MLLAAALLMLAAAPLRRIARIAAHLSPSYSRPADEAHRLPPSRSALGRLQVPLAPRHVCHGAWSRLVWWAVVLCIHVLKAFLTRCPCRSLVGLRRRLHMVATCTKSERCASVLRAAVAFMVRAVLHACCLCDRVIAVQCACSNMNTNPGPSGGPRCRLAFHTRR